MGKEIEYNWKIALLTSVVLNIGGIIIFSINSREFQNPNWSGFGFLIIPLMWIGSFIPLALVKIINKIKGEE